MEYKTFKKESNIQAETGMEGDDGRQERFSRIWKIKKTFFLGCSMVSWKGIGNCIRNKKLYLNSLTFLLCRLLQI